MKKIVFSIIIVFLSIVSSAQAHPPASMDLTYDTSKSALIITMKHISKERKQHYIRKIIVTKNSEEPMTKYSHHQTSPLNVTKEIPLIVEISDVIHVEVFSSKGGSKEASLNVTEETLNPEEISE